MKTLCKKLSCKRLVDVGSPTGYCPLHKRGSASARGYTAQWRALSKRVIAEVGHCEWPSCGTTEDLTTDHINGNRSDWRRVNLRVLCRKHNTWHRLAGNKTPGPINTSLPIN